MIHYSVMYFLIWYRWFLSVCHVRPESNCHCKINSKAVWICIEDKWKYLPSEIFGHLFEETNYRKQAFTQHRRSFIWLIVNYCVVGVHISSSLQGDIGFRGLPGLPGPPGEGLQGPPVFSNFQLFHILHHFCLSSVSVNTSQGHCNVFTYAGSLL